MKTRRIDLCAKNRRNLFFLDGLFSSDFRHFQCYGQVECVVSAVSTHTTPKNEDICNRIVSIGSCRLTACDDLRLVMVSKPVP
jgi:hypothetical protein